MAQQPWLDERLAANGRLVQENFAAYFGASQVVNELGEPLVVYHGSGKPLEAFDDRPTFFTSDPEEASKYAKASWRDKGESYPVVLPVYLALQNPFHMPRQPPRTALWWERKRETLLRRGHDGVVLPLGVFVAFHPWQAKSALANAGLYQVRDASLTDGQAARELERCQEARNSLRSSAQVFHDLALALS